MTQNVLATLIGIPAVFILLALPVSYLVGWIGSHGREKQRRRYFYAYLLGFLIAAPFLSNPKMSSWAAVVALLPFLLVARIYKNRRKAEKSEDAALSQQSAIYLIIQTEMLRLVFRHLKTIVTKYQQAIYRDDYGEIELAEAGKELDYFVENVMKKNLRIVELPEYIDARDYHAYLAANIDAPDFISIPAIECIERFSNVSDEVSWNDAIYEVASDQAARIALADNRTVTFIMGGDYKDLYDETVRASKLDASYQQTIIDFSMHSIVGSTELQSLKKWFTERDAHAASLDDVITGEEFELFCQQRLRELGWEAKTTRATGDFGADLVVEREGMTIIIQCKYYSQPIGVKAVQEAFSAMTFYNAHKVAVVSNESFTKAARQMAQKNGVALLHVSELDRL